MKYCLVPQKRAGVRFRWGISIVYFIPFPLLALSFSTRTRTRINKNLLDSHPSPIFMCKNRALTKSLIYLGEVRHRHGYQDFLKLRTVPVRCRSAPVALKTLSNPTSSESCAIITDYIVAVRLFDFSLWAIFDAWDDED